MKPFLMFFLLTAAVTSSPIVIASVEQNNAIHVGPTSESIDTAGLVSYRAVTKWGVQRLMPGDFNGRETWNIVNSIYAADNPLIDHIVLDRHTLELIGRYAPYFAIGKHYLSATITGQELSGSLNPLDGGDPLIINTHLDESVFEESTLGVILASLPLQIGYRASLPRLAISASTRLFAAEKISIHVIDQEEVAAGDGKMYLAWVVAAEWTGADYQEVHWVANIPPYSIIKKATFPNGRKSESGFVSVTTDE